MTSVHNKLLYDTVSYYAMEYGQHLTCNKILYADVCTEANVSF